MSAHRAGLLQGARDMLKTGYPSTALRLALAADSLMGSDPRTYAAVMERDSLFRTREEITSIFNALADTLALSDNPDLGRYAERIRRRAAFFARRDSMTDAEWLRYYRTLPPHLRLKMSR